MAQYTSSQVAVAIKYVTEKRDQEKEYLDDTCEEEPGSDLLDFYEEVVDDFTDGKLPKDAEYVDALANRIYAATRDGGWYGDSDEADNFNHRLCEILGLVCSKETIENKG